MALRSILDAMESCPSHPMLSSKHPGHSIRRNIWSVICSRHAKGALDVLHWYRLLPSAFLTTLVGKLATQSSFHPLPKCQVAQVWRAGFRLSRSPRNADTDFRTAKVHGTCANAFSIFILVCPFPMLYNYFTDCGQDGFTPTARDSCIAIPA